MRAARGPRGGGGAKMSPRGTFLTRNLKLLTSGSPMRIRRSSPRRSSPPDREARLKATLCLSLC